MTFSAPNPLKSPLLLVKAGGLRGPVIEVQWGGAHSALDGNIVSILGTKERVQCSNHGVCDFVEGTCECYGGYGNSDGRGGQGTIGDCGYRQYSSYNYTVTNSTTVVHTPCPYALDAVCAGNGTCNTATGLCSCFSGYSES